MGQNFMDESDCGNFFDQIDDLIEFPPDNECDDGNDLVSPNDDCQDFSNIWNDTALPDCDPLLSGSHVDSVPDLSAELSVPYEDIVQLEWLSTFVEDSFSGRGMTLEKENLCINKEESSNNQFQISSPVSVLESSTTSSSTSSSTSSEKTIVPLGPHHRGAQKARSKRPRPASFNPRPAIQLIATPGFSPNNNSADVAIPKSDRPEEIKKKPKKIKITLSAGPAMENHHHQPQEQAVRKCLHCEITKTPQWRAGPMGPKTLCNACGVRYKSGRLFPEYRPAASPTFVPSVHSNSHKKVIEMRTKAGPGPMPEPEPEINLNASV